MKPNPITEEIRAIRRQLAEKFGNDLAEIVRDLREREAKSDRARAVLPRRPLTELDLLALAMPDRQERQPSE